MTANVGGCSSKVDSDDLLRILTAAGVGPTSRGKFEDAYTGAWRPESGTLAASVDLLYDFGVAGREFGMVAAAHCLSDIYASLSLPSLATVCLGVPRKAVENGEAGAILSGLNEGLALAGAKLVGGHTVYADSAFVAVTLIGADPKPLEVSPRRQGRYRLLLSKPLGSGIYLAALRNGLLSEERRREVVNLMKLSNAQAAADLASLSATAPDELGFVTDVSGFGLLMSLHGQLPQGSKATVEVSRVPRLEGARSILDTHGISTALGDRNYEWALRGNIAGFAGVPAADRLILSDPQTSGGLLAAVRDEGRAPSVLMSPAWHEIGKADFDASSETTIHVSCESRDK